MPPRLILISLNRASSGFGVLLAPEIGIGRGQEGDKSRSSSGLSFTASSKAAAASVIVFETELSPCRELRHKNSDNADRGAWLCVRDGSASAALAIACQCCSRCTHSSTHRRTSIAIALLYRPSAVVGIAAFWKLSRRSDGTMTVGHFDACSRYSSSFLVRIAVAEVHHVTPFAHI